MVINKIDLIHRQSDLLELGKILTNGTVGGQKITTQPVNLGKLGAVRPKEDIKLHLPNQEKDEKWQLLYKYVFRNCLSCFTFNIFSRLMNKPTYKISWGETKRLFGEECGWPNFDRIFFVSAITSKGIDELRTHLQSLSFPLEGDYPMNEETITWKRPREIVGEHIRSEILNALPGDIAYKLRVNVIEWDIAADEGSDQPRIRMVADVNCDKLRWAQLLAKVMPQIERQVCGHLQNLFGGIADIRIRPRHERQIIGPKEE